MKIQLLIFFFVISSSLFGQELGSVQNGKHSIKILKSDHLFSCVYSDVQHKTSPVEKSFNFPNVDTVYTIIMNGFNDKDHQIFVRTNKDTIIKFEYKTIKGSQMMKIRQNNLDSNTFGSSSFFTKDDIIELFGDLPKG